MSQDVKALAKRIHDLEVRLAAQSRSRQLSSSTIPVTVEGEHGSEVFDVPLTGAVSQGVQAGELAQKLEVELGEAQAELAQALLDAAEALGASATARQEASDAVVAAQQAVDDAFAAGQAVNVVDQRVDSAVATIVDQWAQSSSSTVAPTTGWSSTPPTWVDGQFIWKATTTTYGDGTIDEAAPVVVTGNSGASGSPGSPGAPGRGIDTTAVTYQSGDTGTTAPTGTWSSSIPTVTPGKFLWTRTVDTYTDNSHTTTYSVARMGDDGEPGSPGSPGTPGSPGAPGRGVDTTVVNYKSSTNGTTAPTGSWSTSIPSVPVGSYLWTRTVLTYTDLSTSTSYSVARMAADGVDGDDGDPGSPGSPGSPGAPGKSVTTLTSFYQLSTTQPAVPSTKTPPAAWKTTEPTYTTGDTKNLYVVVRTEFSDNSFSYSLVSIDSAYAAAKEAYIVATNAQDTANGKNKLVRSTNAASSPTLFKAGDQWWRFSGTQIIGMWIHDGTNWVSQTLSDAVITNLNAGSITAGYLSAARIEAETITATKLAANSVIAEKIQANAVIATKIAAGAVIAEKISAGAVTADKIDALAVTAVKLAAGAVIADKIAANSIIAEKIAAGAIDGKLITGATVRTAATGQRVQLDAFGLRTLSSANVETAKLSADGGGLLLKGSLTSYSGGGGTQRSQFGDGAAYFDLPGSPGASTLRVGPGQITAGGSGTPLVIEHTGGGFGSDIWISTASAGKIILDGNVKYRGDTAWLDVTIPNTDSGSVFRWRVKGGRVYIEFDLNYLTVTPPNRFAEDNLTLFVPEYRPADAPIPLRVVSGNQPVMGYVNSNGDFRVRNNTPSNQTRFYGGGNWAID